jgi:hypothetical protein
MDDTLYADGFEDALIGIGIQFDKRLAVYDYEKCVEILIDKEKMNREEAEEWMEFNVVGAYVGEHTPIFLLKRVRA